MSVAVAGHRVRPPRVAMEGICKRFGSTQASADVDFQLAPGEIHALLGENGAGKSTLMSILFGMVTPDTGRIVVGDEDITFRSPADALTRGIGMVHQHFMLVPNLTVAENVAIGSSRPGHAVFPRRTIEAEIAAVATRSGLDVDPSALVADLSVEEKQRVEIVRLLYRGAKVIILDEPTGALGSAQVGQLLATLEALRDVGHSIVIVTHKLEEVMRVADRATVLRAGRAVGTFASSAFTEASLASAMFGQLPASRPRAPRTIRSSEPRLRVRGLEARSQAGRPALRGLDLDVAAGEIVGIAAVAGNGQGELAEVIAGTRAAEDGSLTLDGRDLAGLPPLQRRALGVRIIPEDRHRSGLVLDMTVAENLALSEIPAGRFARYGLVRRQAMRRQAAEQVKAFGVRPSDPGQKVLQLSGGNQQKVVVARELSGSPRLLVAVSPTRGLDMSAAASVRSHIEATAQRGCGVVLISPDLDELVAMADRVVVLFEGRVVHCTASVNVDMSELGLAMVGRSENTAPGPEHGPVAASR